MLRVTHPLGASFIWAQDRFAAKSLLATPYQAGPFLGSHCPEGLITDLRLGDFQQIQGGKTILRKCLQN